MVGGSLRVIWKRADCEVGELVDDSGTRLKCYKPRNIVRAEDYPILSETTNIVVLKTSWPGIDRQHNGTEMYQGCNGRFGVMPHVSSYEVTGQYGEVISNILFFPEKDKIGDYHWVVSPRMPPTELDIRTYDYSILSLNGRPLIHAENPFELSRAWACFLIGMFEIMLRILSIDQALHQGGYPCIYPGTCIGILA